VILLAGLIYSAGFLSQCGPAVAPATTQAIIRVESGGDPFAIGDNNLKKSFSPGSKREAVSLATQLIARGHSVDLGLMQINSQHLGPMGLSLEDAFDPCRNVKVGTTILADFYQRYRTGDPAGSLMKALSAYNTGQAWKGADYVNRILAAAGVNYRVMFVPVEGAPTGAAGPIQKTQKTRLNSRNSPFHFGNTTTAMVPGKGFR
jgi:type IV secretion system protein VirB1